MAARVKAKVTSKCKTSPKSPFTRCEWKKIEQLACVKCAAHKCVKQAKKHIEAL